MQEKTRVIIRRDRRPTIAEKQFSFDVSQVRAEGVLAEYRQHAWRLFESMPMPSLDDEAWRRTDLRAMPVEAFRLPSEEDHDLTPIPQEILHPLVADQHGGQIVLFPHRVRAEIEPSLQEKGVVFTDLRTAEREYPHLVARVAGKVVRPDEGKFAALAAALAWTGIFLYVPKGVRLERPLHSILWGPGSNLAYISHIMVLVDEEAEVTYVHEAASPTEAAASFHAGLVEIVVSAGARLHFVELQSWGRHVWNFSHERMQVGRDASVDWIFGAVGSKLTKNFSELDLVGEGASGRMSGFYFTDDQQHLDHDTQQNHLAPHTTSDLLFKGALKGKSRSVWQGMIYVAPNAQRADGYQANRNLVLSEEARADSIPGLEICANDVRCTHGATVGRLEEAPLFYLLSRGIPRPEAERLLVEGFFDPIMQRIPFDGVRERFQQAIEEKLSQ
uniref:Fe-S cluster assembly protein SufD n=1 Tax=uncultured Chloroflexota bacterium TaxID=166587 RepID=H5SPG9_9CHLR|nr:Fe-S cluster assembly protein SufD [uncultured Chloroflexota bacterium]BAL58055.1 Fe-S cluster assembly protein SufD [uncultured Chloroflexota bacterium]